MARSAFAMAVLAACLAGFFTGAWVVGRFGETQPPPQPETQVADAVPASRPANQAAVSRSEQRLARIEAKLDRLLLAEPATPTDRPPNVLLIIPDTMSGHLVGFNNPERAMTPNLDRFASKSLNFRNAISQAGWTSPSMASILTGLYPNQHGCAATKKACVEPLPADIVTLATAFRSHGYYTVAFVGLNADWFRPALRGFNHVEVSRDPTGAESIASVIDLLAKPSEMPHLILLHIFDPHSPWLPIMEPILPPEIMSWPLETRRQLRGPKAFASEVASRGQEMFYIREIEELDLRLRELLSSLDSEGGGLFRPDRDIVVFTSDHGEEFWYQNGFTEHGRSHHIETIRVPLLLRIPGVEPGTVSSYVENAGVFSTLLEVLGWGDPRPRGINAPSSLDRFIEGGEVEPETPSYVLSEAIYIDSQNVPGAHEFKTLLRHDGYKLVYDTQTEQVWLFDLERDLTEDRDLAKGDRSHPIVAELLGEVEARTDLRADYPTAPGEYWGGALAVPLPETTAR